VSSRRSFLVQHWTISTTEAGRTFVPQRRNTSKEHRRDGDLGRASEKESVPESPDAEKKGRGGRKGRRKRAEEGDERVVLQDQDFGRGLTSEDQET